MAVCYVKCFSNGKFYIGVTKDYNRRMKQHISDAKRNVQLVHRAMNKHVHITLVLAELDDYELIKEVESVAIEVFKQCEKELYNISMGVHDNKHIVEVIDEECITVVKNKVVLERFTATLSRADKSRVQSIMDNITPYGRLNYGKYRSQYCRDFKDIEKIITDLSKNKLGQFIKKIRDLQIIRMVTIDKGCEGSDSFLTFNPAIAINGHFDNKHIHSAWKDVIEEYSLVKRKKIKVPLHQDNIDSFIFGLTEEEVEERYPEYLKYYKRTKEKVMESLGGK